MIRLLINDFGGYPFPIQLSKHLAKHNYEVVHTYVSNIKTPHGNMENGDNLENLTITPILLNTEFKKYSIIGRYRGEYEFAKKINAIIDTFKPDIVISANTPLIAQSILLEKCKVLNIKFVYWCQDIHSIALTSYLRKKIPVFGRMGGRYFKRKEIKLLEKSDFVITIADAFNGIFKKWGISQNNIQVIQNWGPINEIELKPKVNPWSVAMGFDSKLLVLYSGTLGLKHNPLLISEAAKHFSDNANVAFLVISEGIGADILLEQKKINQLANLFVLPYQEYDSLSNVLGSADILVSILEDNASLFSVPSKVLSYLCAQKPIVLSVPKSNLSSEIVLNTKSGYCVEPGNLTGFVHNIKILLSDTELRSSMGQNGRKFAEDNFDVDEIAGKFIKIFNSMLNES